MKQTVRVRQLAKYFFLQVSKNWELDSRCRDLLSSACALHEVGLSIDFRKSPEHASYLINNIDLPAFTTCLYSGIKSFTRSLIEKSARARRSSHSKSAKCIVNASDLFIVQAITFSDYFASRRRDDTLPTLRLDPSSHVLTIILPYRWLVEHSLRAENLQQEDQWQSYVNWPLEFEERNSANN